MEERDPVDVELEKLRKENKELKAALEEWMVKELVRGLVRAVVPNLAEKVVAGVLPSPEFEKALGELFAGHGDHAPEFCKFCKLRELRGR